MKKIFLLFISLVLGFTFVNAEYNDYLSKLDKY
jgi:hypothetical protein